jgi:nitroreductase
MDLEKAIVKRVSIRKWQDKPVEKEKILKVLDAGRRAPSWGNVQPWRFIVVGLDKRDEMMKAMRRGIARAKAQREELGSAEWTADVMEQAPVTIFVYNPHGIHPWQKRAEGQVWMDVVNIQSIGACIENMLLAAEELGLGSLWICDVFTAYAEFAEWLGEKSQLIAAVSFGYAGESPEARARKPVEAVTRWL